MVSRRRSSSAWRDTQQIIAGPVAGMFSARFVLVVLCATIYATGVATAAVPVYPCLIQAEDYNAGGEGVGHHDTTPGNAGGAYRWDDVDVWRGGEVVYVGNTTPGEWLEYTFSVNANDTEHYPIPVRLRVMSDRQETWIGVGVDGATPRTFPVWTTPGVWRTEDVHIAYPTLGPHRLRIVFPDGDIQLDSIEIASNHASGWGDIWGGDPGLAASAAPVTGCAPLMVRFSDRSRPYPMSNWQWDFSDGTSSREQNPVHVYSSPGSYTVTLFAQAGSYWNYPMWVAVWDMDTCPLYLGSKITVYSPPVAVPGSNQTPLDPDGDGLYEDLNGNGREEFLDIVLFFNQMAWIAANEPIPAFDLNGNGRIDFADVVVLFNRL